MIEKKAGEFGDRVRQVIEGGTQFDVAFTFGFTLLAATALGYYGGLYLDEHLGTAPYLMVTGVLLGIIAAFRILLRDIIGKEPPGGRARQDEASGDDSG